jgi:hypothetical protein
MQSACAVLYCHLWPIWLNHIFSTLSHKRHDFRIKKLLNIKCKFWFLCKLVWNISHFRRIQRDIIINVSRSSCKEPVIFVRCWWNLNFTDRFSKNTQISNFVKIPSAGAELFHADALTGRQRGGRTDMTVGFCNFANAPKKTALRFSHHCENLGSCKNNYALNYKTYLKQNSSLQV